MAKHNEFGKIGEDIAANHLLKNGYEILDRNWIYLKKELDIIAVKDDFLVVVEVKSRSTEYFEHPADAITLRKIRHIVNATQAYVDSKRIVLEVRFDVISVIKKNDEYHLEHIENAFIAPVG